MHIANITKTGFLHDSPFIYYTYGGECVPRRHSGACISSRTRLERAFRNAIGPSRVTMPREIWPKCYTWAYFCSALRRGKDALCVARVKLIISHKLCVSDYYRLILLFCLTAWIYYMYTFFSSRNKNTRWINADSMQTLIVYNIFYSSLCHNYRAEFSTSY